MTRPEYDLFDNPDALPVKVRQAIEHFGRSNQSYEDCEQLHRVVARCGFTFEYGLDACPHSLKIDELATAKLHERLDAITRRLDAITRRLDAITRELKRLTN